VAKEKLKSETKVMIPKPEQRPVALPTTKAEIMISLRLARHRSNLAGLKT
jgi:1,4-dihydroxy-2-naphthoyl-CoA synthase